MNHYLKVALLTLVFSVAFAEILGPLFGLRGYIGPTIMSLLGGSAPSGQTTDEAHVASLELTDEQNGDQALAQEPVGVDMALDSCIAAIKSVSLHPDFTQLPTVKAEEDDDIFKFVWNKNAPARTMNADGAEISLLATCQVKKANGYINFLSINGKSLVDVAAGRAALLGNWRLERKVSEVDNSTNVTVTTKAIAPVNIQGKQVNPQLVLHCGEDKTVSYIDMGTEVGAGTLRVTTVLQNDESSSRWNIGSDRQSVFPDGQYIGLIKLMLEAPDLKVQMAPNGGDTVEIQFDLEGLPAAISPLQEACHWK
ncbi:MAG: hypothetical protein KDJ38_11570 [Gammaproteobacteria bacterium]|nr:hypothetical protein [Gammaproteobacteria bacterium]